MPIYEYQCQDCGEKTEALQKVSDAPLTKCPHCQQDSLKKQISSTSFQLKGTGWYVTDFRDKNKPKDKKATETKPKADNKKNKPAKSKDKSSVKD